MSVKIEFTHKNGDDYFKVTTQNGSYEKQVKYMTMFWAKQRMEKLGLNPEETIKEIFQGYFKWRKENERNRMVR